MSKHSSKLRRTRGWPYALTLCGLGLGTSPAVLGEISSPAPGMRDILDTADQQADAQPVSPVLRIHRDGRRGNESAEPALQRFDGKNNNLGQPRTGAAHVALLRIAPANYADGVSTLAGADRPGARTISNQVNTQGESRPNPLGLSDYLWQWGQFIDHDIDLTDGVDPAEPLDIEVPTGDPWFDPQRHGDVVISFNRSLWDLDSGTSRRNPRQQVNEITAWIDGSNVYGSDIDRAQALRTLDGSGRLKTSEGNLLPFNVDGLANAGGNSEALFVAGDVRANEQAALAAMHTLFVREHNWQAARVAQRDPDLNGDEIFDRARRRVIAQIQAITYREWLPALLGPDPLPAYRGYDPDIDAGIANSFSTAAFRFGHSLLSPQILRLNSSLQESESGHLSLADAFFAPARLTEEGGIDPILRGLAWQTCQDFDVYVIDEVRNFLFGAPGNGGFDLAALNIQRGRDHGLPGYNDLRVAYGLEPARSLRELSSSREVRQRLRSVYTSPGDMDAWIGGLAEDPLPNAMVGELVFAVVADQFQRLRDGDRFWYQRVLNERAIREVERTTLADVIRRNTEIGNEIDDDVFRVADGR